MAVFAFMAGVVSVLLLQALVSLDLQQQLLTAAPALWTLPSPEHWSLQLIVSQALSLWLDVSQGWGLITAQFAHSLGVQAATILAATRIGWLLALVLRWAAGLLLVAATKVVVQQHQVMRCDQPGLRIRSVLRSRWLGTAIACALAAVAALMLLRPVSPLPPPSPSLPIAPPAGKWRRGKWRRGHTSTTAATAPAASAASATSSAAFSLKLSNAGRALALRPLLLLLGLQCILPLLAYATSHLSPLTSHLSPLTSHLSPLTSHLSPSPAASRACAPRRPAVSSGRQTGSSTRRRDLGVVSAWYRRDLGVISGGASGCEVGGHVVGSLCTGGISAGSRQESLAANLRRVSASLDLPLSMIGACDCSRLPRRRLPRQRLPRFSLAASAGDSSQCAPPTVAPRSRRLHASTIKKVCV